jgi:ribosomal protein S24E
MKYFKLTYSFKEVSYSENRTYQGYYKNETRQDIIKKLANMLDVRPNQIHVKSWIY